MSTTTGRICRCSRAPAARSPRTSIVKSLMNVLVALPVVIALTAEVTRIPLSQSLEKDMSIGDLEWLGQSVRTMRPLGRTGRVMRRECEKKVSFNAQE